MRIYGERTKSERKQTNAKKDDNNFRISELLMLIILLSAPSAVKWRASQSVLFGDGPFTLFHLPVKMTNPEVHLRCHVCRLPSMQQ